MRSVLFLTLILGQLLYAQQDATFLMESLDLKVKNHKNLVVVAEDGPDLTINLTYEGQMNAEMRLKGTLSGPGISTPHLIDQTAQKLSLTFSNDVFSEIGIYRITGLRLEYQGQAVAVAEPRTTTIEAVDSLLVTGATVEEVSQQELADQGFAFNESDYRAVKFNVNLAMGSNQLIETFHLMVPKNDIERSWQTDIEVIQNPFRKRGKFIAVPINTYKNKKLGPFEHGQFQIDTEGHNAETEGYQIYSLLLIPGEMSYFKGHFNVAALVLNDTPEGFNVRVSNLKAEIELPDPTRYGYPLKIRDQNGNPIRDITRGSGSDSLFNSVSANYLDPGEEGKASFLLTGEQPGMWDVQIDIKGEADFPQGTVDVTGTTTAKVFVRSRAFSVSFEHPATVAEQQDYDFKMLVFNKSSVPLESFSVTLDPETLIGTELQATTDPQQSLASIAPGETGTLSFGLRSLINGSVAATYHRIHDGSDSNLALSVGVGNDGETLTHFSVAFPERFDDVVPPQLNQAFRVYAKKLIDFAQTEPDLLPPGVSDFSMSIASTFFQDITSAALFLDWVDQDLGSGYLYDSDTAALAMLTTYLNNQPNLENLDGVRRYLLEQANAAWDLELAFSQMLETRFASQDAETLLTRLSYEADHIQHLRVVLLEGIGLDGVAVTGASGTMSGVGSSKLRDLPHSGMFNVGSQRLLIWLGTDDTNVSISLPDTAQDVTLTGLLTDQNQTRILTSAMALDQDGPLQCNLDLQGQLSVETLTGSEQQEPEYQILNERPFSLIGIRQVDPLVFPHVNRFNQLGQQNDLMENGRFFLLTFSKPVAMSSLHPLEGRISINGVGAEKAFSQSDPRLVVVASSQVVGNNFPIEYNIENVLSKDQEPLATGKAGGTFQGSDWLRGAYIRGRITDHMNTDLSKAKVYLSLVDRNRTLTSSRTNQNQASLGHYIDVADVQADGTYQLDFVALNREFLGTQGKFTTESVYPGSVAQIVALLEDGRFKALTLHPLTSGQEVQGDLVFSSTGSVWGQVRNQQGEPQAGVEVYLANQQTPSSAKLVTTDENGVYRADGIEVGPISVRTEVEGFVGMETGYLTKANNPMRLDLQPTLERGHLRGRVTIQRDGVSIPVTNALVAYTPSAVATQTLFEYNGAAINAHAITYTNADGEYFLPSVPAGQAVVTTVIPGITSRKENVIVAVNGETEFNVDFTEQWVNGGFISGRVFDQFGNPQEDAYVSVYGTYDSFVTTKTDETGRFELSPVLLNQNVLVVAKVEQANGSYDRGRYYLSLTDDVPEITDIEIHLSGQTTLSGTYTNFAGQSMPYRTVKLFSPDFGPFSYQTDAQGDFSGTIHASRSVMWRMGSVDYPRITYQDAFIAAGQPNQINIRQWGFESLKARLIDGHGNPVIGRIFVQSMLPEKLTGLAPPQQQLSHVFFSDLEDFTTFSDINYGPVTIWGEHPILGTTQRYDFEHGLNSNREGLREIVLSLPRSEPGRLHGFVYNADGTPAPAGTVVHATFSGVNATTLCNEGGYYNFTSLVNTIQPKTVQLFASHIDSERYASKTLVLNQDLSMRSDLILKGRGNVTVRVVDHEGAPVEDGDLIVKYDTYTNNVPASVRDAIASGNFNLDNVAMGDVDAVSVSQTKRVENVRMSLSEPYRVFSEIPAGSVSVRAISGAGLAGFAEAAIPTDGGDIDVIVRLEKGSTIRGVFVDRLDQPIPDAQITFAFQNYVLGSVTTAPAGDQAGTFEIAGLPMRTYNLVGYQPDTNFEGEAEVTSSPFIPEPFVKVMLDELGHIDGLVLMEDTTLPAVSANVTLYLENARKLETATNSQGSFRFENIPLGDYSIEVQSPFTQSVASKIVTISQAGEVSSPELVLGRGYSLSVLVQDSDGSLLPGAQVLLQSEGEKKWQYIVFTGPDSVASFKNLPRGLYTVSSNIQKFGKRVQELVSINGSQDQYELELVMPDLLNIRGNVRDSLGLVPGSRVTVSAKQGLGPGAFIKTSTIDSNGNYFIPGVPFGHTKVFAYDPDTGNTVMAPPFYAQPEDGLERVVDLELKAVTSASGVLLDANGDPVSNAPVWVEEPMFIKTFTDQTGQFTIYPYLDKAQTVYANDPNSPRTAAALFPKPEAISSGLLPITDQVLMLQPMFDVEGTVRLNDGTPIIGTQVSAINVATAAEYTVPSQSNGYYYLEHLPIGQYEVTAYDIIRREHSSPALVVESSQDSNLLQRDITFQPNYYVAGRILDSQGNGAANATVEIFRQIERNNTAGLGYFLVDALETNQDGFFTFETLYPGEYRIRAENTLQTLSKQVDFTLLAQSRQDIEIDLNYESSFLVSVKTPSGLPYQDVIVDLFRGGRLYERIKLFTDGTGEIPRMTTEVTHYTVTINGGWTTLQGSFELLPGPNFYELVGPEIVKLTGEAIYQNVAGGVPYVAATVNGHTRGADILADGYFELDQIPANQPVELTLRKGASNRTISYAGFTQDTDLGTLLLNGGPPQVTPVAETMNITGLPHTFIFNVDHPHDQTAVLDPANTKFGFGNWLGDRFQVVTDGNQVRVTLHPEQATMQRGEYYLRLNVAREDNLNASYTQYVTLDPPGTTLLVTPKNGNQFGSYSLDQGQTWHPADNPDQIILANITEPAMHLIVRNPFEEKANRLDLDLDHSILVEVVALSLHDYAGAQGTVYLPDGTTPATNVRVAIGDYWTVSDVNGQYSMDYMIVNNFRSSAVKGTQGTRIGYHSLPTSVAPFQMIPGNYVILKGRGQLEIHAVQADGTTPVPNANFELTYPDFPSTNTEQFAAALDENARWNGEVVATDFEVEVTDPINDLCATAQGTFAAENTSESITVTLLPTHNVSGTLLDTNSSPIDAARVLLIYNSSILDEVVTDATGSFNLTGIPFDRDVTLIAYQENLQLSHKLTLQRVQADQSLGNLTLNADMSPSFARFDFPQTVFVSDTALLQSRIEDELGIKRLTMTFSDGYAFTETLNWTIAEASTSEYHYKYFSFPSDITPGDFVFTLEAEDFLGQIHSEQRTLSYIEDLVGPDIVISEPQANSIFTEGDAIPFSVSASDTNGIAHVAIYWQDQLLAERSNYTYTGEVPAVNVTQSGTVDYTIRATDNAGNVSEVTLPLSINAIQTTSPPLAQLRYPLDGMVLPLSLTSGLNIPFQLHAQDQQALQRYELYVADTLLFEGLLFGQTMNLTHEWQVPSELRSQAQLTFTLRTWNVGDELTEITATVDNIEGQVFDEATPLSLAEFDQSQINQTLILASGDHLIDGQHTFANLVLVNGATLTQRTTNLDTSWFAQTELTVNHFVLSPDSNVDMNAKGFASSAPFIATYAAGNHAGSGNGSGGFGLVYGSPVDPRLPGTLNGGGYFGLDAQAAWLSGTVEALPQGRSGSGGSINITTQQLAGFGQLDVTGFSHNSSGLVTGSGGRIAITAPNRFAGERHATSETEAVGTIYERVADATYPDGYRDIITLHRHSEVYNGANAATLLMGLKRQVDSDITIETNVQPSPELPVRDVLRLPDAEQLPQQYFIGFEVWVNGSLRTTVVDQSLNNLWVPANSIGSYTTGDFVEVKMPLDELHVANSAIALTYNQPLNQLTLDKGILVGFGDTELETIALDNEGSIFANNLVMSNLQLDTAYPLGFAGSLVADQVVIASGTTLTEPVRYLDVLIPQILADNAMPSEAIQGLGFYESAAHSGHGGLANTASVIGSPYQPQTYSYNSHIQILASTVQVDGHINLGNHLTEGSTSSYGGSLWLQASSLTGTGTISAGGSSGGGRLAIIADDISNFSGQATAFSRLGGAGTVFWKTAQHPNGRLVIDNGGTQAPTASTYLDGLGARTLASDTSDTHITASNLPAFNALAGMHLAIGTDEVRPIQSNTSNALTLAQPLSQTYPANTSYQGRHILDELVLAGGASLDSLDPIYADKITYAGGSTVAEVVETGDNGTSFTLDQGAQTQFDQDPGYTDYIVDNATLILNYPANVASITLLNNAILRYNYPINATDISITDSTIISAVSHESIAIDAATVSANNITLQNATWRGATSQEADHLTYFRMTRLNFNVQQTLSVDATSTIGFTHRDQTEGAFIWDGSSLLEYGHGGNRGNLENTTTGSFAYPRYPGNGGAIAIKAQHLHLQGTLRAATYNHEPGGSVLVETVQGSGSGQINVMDGNHISGGRIAVYYQGDGSFLNHWQLKASPDSHWYDRGAGTVFTKSDTQTYGTLRVDQNLEDADDDKTRFANPFHTGVAGPKSITLGIDDDDLDPLVIRDRSRTDIPHGLEGLWARFTVDSTAYELQVIENSRDTIRFAQPTDGNLPPAVIPDQTALTFVLKLDRLELINGGMLVFDGIVSVNEIDTQNTVMTNGLICDQLELPSPFTLDNQHLMLWPYNQDLGNLDLNLVDSKLWLVDTLQLNQLDMTRSQIHHLPYTNSTQEWVKGVDLILDTLRMDSDSRIDVSGLHSISSNTNSVYSYGSPGRAIDDFVHGNFLFPNQVGNTHSGGLIRVRANLIDNANFWSNGPNIAEHGSHAGAAGSIWIEAQTLNGNIDLQAHQGSSTTSGGAGRIALHADNPSNATITYDLHGVKSSGTYFSKTGTQTYGTLIIPDQDPYIAGGTEFEKLTPLPSFGVVTLPVGITTDYDTTTDQTNLQIPAWSDTTQYTGHELVIGQQTPQRYSILQQTITNDTTTFTLAGNASTISAGDIMRLGVTLDTFAPCADCVVPTGPLSLRVPSDGIAPQITALELETGRTWIDSGSNFNLITATTDDTDIDRTLIEFAGQSYFIFDQDQQLLSIQAPTVASDTQMPLTLTTFDSNNNQSSLTLALDVLAQDTTAPSVTFVEPTPPSVNGGDSLYVEVDASDNRLLESVSFNFAGATQTMQTNQAQGTFTTTIQTSIFAGQHNETLSVTVLDAMGNSTSETLDITINDITPPEDISDLNNSVTATSISWNWTLPSDAYGDLDRFHLYVDGSSTPTVLAASETSFTLDGLSSGNTHELRITAVDQTGNESSGLTSSATTLSFGAGNDLPTPLAYFSMDQPQSKHSLVNFNKNESLISHGPQQGLQGKTALTLAFSVKADTTSYGCLVQMTYLNGQNFSSMLQVRDTSIGFSIGLGRAGSSTTFNATARTFRDDQWHRFVIAIDYLAGTADVYLDNQHLITRTLSSAMMTVISENLSAPFAIGSYHHGSGDYQGRIADVQLWDQAWNSSEVEFDYRSHTLVSDAPGSSLNRRDNLLAHWPLNDGQGQSASDISGNGYTAHSHGGNLLWVNELAPVSALPNLAGSGTWHHANGEMETGISGTALKLDRGILTDSKSEPASLTTPPFDTTWTLSSYFMLEELPSVAQQAANLLSIGGAPALSIKVNTSDQLEIDWVSGSQTLSQTLTNQTWYQLALTVSGTQAQIYLNGVALDSPIDLTGWTPVAGEWSSGGDTAHFRLDEVSYWNTALSANQIQQIHTAYTTGDTLYNLTALKPADEVRALQLTPAPSGLHITWQAPDSAVQATGYRLYLDGNTSPINLANTATNYTHDPYNATTPLPYRITTMYGNAETTGINGIFLPTTTPLQPGSIAQPDNHWDLQHPQLGNALLYYDASNAVSLPTYTDVFDGAQEATVTLWVNIGPWQSRTNYIFSAENDSNQFLMKAQASADFDLIYSVRRTTGAAAYLRSGDNGLAVGWNKVHLVANWNTGNFKLFINGQLLAEADYPTDPPGPIMTGQSRYITIGTNQYRSARTQNAYFTDTQIWTKAFDNSDAAFDHSNYLGLATDRVGTGLSANDLRAHWPLHSDDTSLNDLSGNGYHLEQAYGTTTWSVPASEPQPATTDLVAGSPMQPGGATSVNGRSQNGLMLDNQVAQFTTPTNWNPTAGLSISSFFKVDATSIAAAMDTALISRTTQQGQLDLEISAAGLLHAYLPNGTHISATSAIDISDWIHLVLTDTTNGDLAVYLNGHPYLEISNGATWSDAILPWFLGGDGRQTARRAMAQFDEITTWNRALSAAETAGIYAIYQNNDNIANAFSLGISGGGLTDGKEGHALPDGATQIGEKTWELRNTQATIDDLIVDGDFILIGSTLTVTGQIQARSLYLRDGAMLTVTPQSQAQTPGLRMLLTGTLEVDARSHINLDGIALNIDQREPNLAHAAYAHAENPGQLKGALLMPKAVGGGNQGGGAFYLQADQFKLDGQLTAKGIAASAGGSVWLELNQLSGFGHINVSGGQQQDIVAGGGRVTIYSDQFHRFNGTIVTGSTPQTAGSLILAKRNGNDLIADRGFPWLQRLPELPDALQINKQQVELLGLNGFGELLKVSPGKNLEPYAGAWLDNGHARVRIIEVVNMGDGTYLLQLAGQITQTSWQQLTIVIEARQPQQWPNRVPLVPQR